MLNVTEKDLKNEITDMQERYPHLQHTELFVAWFMKCFVTEKEEDAIAAFVGGPRNKSLDAILIDGSARTLFVIQGKYRQRSNGGLEHRADITSFAEPRLFATIQSMSSNPSLRSLETVPFISYNQSSHNISL
jgi:hypothetical protein